MSRRLIGIKPVISTRPTSRPPTHIHQALKPTTSSTRKWNTWSRTGDGGRPGAGVACSPGHHRGRSQRPHEAGPALVRRPARERWRPRKGSKIASGEQTLANHQLQNTSGCSQSPAWTHAATEARRSPRSTSSSHGHPDQPHAGPGELPDVVSRGARAVRPVANEMRSGRGGPGRCGGTPSIREVGAHLQDCAEAWDPPPGANAK